MDTHICKNCVHFHQHYVLNSHRGVAIDCGHCSYSRRKHRSATASACVHFTFREMPAPLPDREKVIDFLRHIMNLKLPPVIVKENEEFD